MDESRGFWCLQNINIAYKWVVICNRKSLKGEVKSSRILMPSLIFVLNRVLKNLRMWTWIYTREIDLDAPLFEYREKGKSRKQDVLTMSKGLAPPIRLAYRLSIFSSQREARRCCSANVDSPANDSITCKHSEEGNSEVWLHRGTILQDAWLHEIICELLIIRKQVVS